MPRAHNTHARLEAHLAHRSSVLRMHFGNQHIRITLRRISRSQQEDGGDEEVETVVLLLAAALTSVQ